MVFLTASHTTVIKITLPPSTTLPQVLALLHDHGAMISMNPLVISHRRLPPSTSTSSPSRPRSSSTSSSYQENLDGVDAKPLPPPPTYEVVDSLENNSTSIEEESINNDTNARSWTARITAKLSPSTVTYTAQMRNLPYGLETVIHAPMGIRNVNTWSVRDVDGSLVLEESSVMSANRLIIGFVSKTAKESHEKLVGRFVTRLEKGVDEGGWAGDGIQVAGNGGCID